MFQTVASLVFGKCVRKFQQYLIKHVKWDFLMKRDILYSEVVQNVSWLRNSSESSGSQEYSGKGRGIQIPLYLPIIW